MLEKLGGDQLSMLLSTDWFFYNWRILSIDIEENDRRILKFRFRDVVKNFIGDSRSYWDCAFSEDRINRTISELNLVFIEHKNTDLLPIIESYVQSFHGPKYNDTIDIISMITDSLCYGGDISSKLPIDDKISYFIRSIWEENTIDMTELEESWLDSDTDWDVFIRSLTADDPEFVFDYLKYNVIGHRNFLNFWNKVNKLDKIEKDKILLWYQSIGADISNDFDLSCIKI